MTSFQPEDYLDSDIGWQFADLQQECCRLAGERHQQAHLLESLLDQLERKGQAISELESHIRHLKALGMRIASAADFQKNVLAGKTSEERMAHLYSGGQDD